MRAIKKSWQQPNTDKLGFIWYIQRVSNHPDFGRLVATLHHFYIENSASPSGGKNNFEDFPNKNPGLEEFDIQKPWFWNFFMTRRDIFQNVWDREPKYNYFLDYFHINSWLRNCIFWASRFKSFPGGVRGGGG